MSESLLDLVRELNTLNDDNLADRVITNSDVQWCLSELQDILEAEQPTLTPPNEWVSVEERLPKYNIREDGELVSSKILVRCEIDKTVHLVVSKKFYTGRPGEMVHSVFRFYDEWGDIIENVSHWMPLPEPPTDLEKRMGGHNG